MGHVSIEKFGKLFFEVSRASTWPTKWLASAKSCLVSAGQIEDDSQAEAEGDNCASERACNGVCACCSCDRIGLLTGAEHDYGDVDEPCGHRKYEYKPDWSDEQHQIVFKVKPRIAHAWNAPRMHRSLVNFIF